MFYPWIFILGLIIGSFLNVVILRYNSGRSVNGRSGCLSCGKKLKWYELIPVVSFAIQGGRCRHCHCRISWQYPLVELLTGFAFALIFAKYYTQPLSLIFFWLIICLFIVITVYDIKHKIIPDAFVFLLILLGLSKPLLSLIQSGSGSLLSLYLNAAIGGLVIGGIFLALWLISKGEWLGFGDVKLALAVGLLLGLENSLSAMILAVWIGAFVGVSLIVLGKTKLFGLRKYFTMKSELPFAPFIIIGTVLVLFFELHVF